MLERRRPANVARRVGVVVPEEVTEAVVIVGTTDRLLEGDWR